MDKQAKIYLAGHRGLVGSAIHKSLLHKGYTHIVCRTHTQLDLTKQDQVQAFFEEEKPEYVFLAAAKVGGIVANNTYRADFIYENLLIQSNVIHASYQHGVKKLLFLGSTCIYPKEAKQPITEDSLLTGPLEYTNEPYALAKIAGINMCESYNLQYGTNFISVMPTNLYGPNDNFDLEKSHVLPALLRKIYLGRCLLDKNWEAVRDDLNKRPVAGVSGEHSKEAILATLLRFGISEQQVEIWGTGAPLREFLWSEEMADASVFIMEQVNFSDLVIQEKEIRNTHINIGTGEEISIKALAQLLASTIGYRGNLYFNSSKPDGTARKLTNVSKLHALGWKHQISCSEGVQLLYQWYLNNNN